MWNAWDVIIACVLGLAIGASMVISFNKSEEQAAKQLRADEERHLIITTLESLNRELYQIKEAIVTNKKES